MRRQIIIEITDLILKFKYTLAPVFFIALTGSAQPDYVVQNVTVIPMHGSQTEMTGQDVFVQMGKISWIGVTGVRPYGNAEIMNGGGKYLMPGLSEMHAHIPVPRDGDDTNVRETLFLYLANGVTTIRGMLGNPYHLDLKKQVVSGDIASPRIYTSSPSMNGNSVQTIKEAVEKVEQHKSDGFDFLKIHPGIKLDVMGALVATADRVGIRFAGHVPAEVGVSRAIDYHYWSIDHADGFVEGLLPDDPTRDLSSGGFFGSNFAADVDLEKLPELAAQAVENEVWLVPTQSLFTRWISPTPSKEMMRASEFNYLRPQVRNAWLRSKSQMINNPEYSEDNYHIFLKVRQQILKGLFDAGVKFLLGSDSPQVMNVPGFSIVHEIQAVVDCGIPVYDVLKSGTANPAEFFGATGQYGVVAVGAEADLILLDSNPLDNVQAIRLINAVFYRGILLTREAIDLGLAEIAERNSGL